MPDDLTSDDLSEVDLRILSEDAVAVYRVLSDRLPLYLNRIAVDSRLAPNRVKPALDELVEHGYAFRADGRFGPQFERTKRELPFVDRVLANFGMDRHSLSLG